MPKKKPKKELKMGDTIIIDGRECVIVTNPHKWYMSDEEFFADPEMQEVLKKLLELEKKTDVTE